MSLFNRNIPPELQPALEILLANSPAGEAALHRLDEFSRRNPAEFQEIAFRPFGLQSLVSVFSYSRFLSEEVTQNPEWLLEGLTTESLNRVRSCDELQARLRQLLELHSGEPLPPLLAQFRRGQILRILLRDVLGFGGLSEVTEELSNLADSILHVTYEKIKAELAERYGVPRLETGEPCGFSVLALGKLGGRELNYSSDIDLMFLYEGQGATDGEQSISNKEFFKKLSNQFTDILSTYTPRGFAYRVDLRLRPDGRLGEVCISLDGAQGYYTQRARDWELQMLIKARIAAGDQTPGRKFLDWVQPMIYSTTLDFGTIESMSETRERISEKLNQRRRADVLDIKLTRGGIRDVEFLVQCLQRLHGGHQFWVRNSSTLLALVRLRDKDLLSDSEYSRLASAYQFLRHLEHRLQFDEDRQTHLLPERTEELSVLARRMPPGLLRDNPSADRLLKTLNAQMEHVTEVYGRVVHAQQPMYYTLNPVTAAPEPMPVAGSRPEGEETPLPTNLIRFLDSRAPKLAGVVSRARLGRSQSSFEHFLERAIKQPAWMEVLNEDSILAGYVVDLFEHSPFLAEQMVRTPELFEEFRLMREEGAPEHPYADTMPFGESPTALRRSYRRQLFRLQIESICLQVPIFTTLQRSSMLADVAIASCYRLAISQVVAQHPPTQTNYSPWLLQMMVIALGRLGMQEFDLGSDADLVFVIPDEDMQEHAFWTRVAEKFIDILSAYTGEGTFFSVDTRLRPNGKAGALVQSESTVLDYFRKNAEAWEGITYMKTRGIAGDLQRATTFLESVQHVDWQRYGQKTGRSKKELRQMRMRVEKEHGASNPLKAGPGGYFDIDFALMYLRLRGAGMFYPVLNTPKRIEIIERMGHLEPADANFLRDGATFYRAVDHGLRLISGHTEGSLPSSESQLQMLTELVSRWTPDHLHDQPLPLELKQIQLRTREYFDRLFGI